MTFKFKIQRRINSEARLGHDFSTRISEKKLMPLSLFKSMNANRMISRKALFDVFIAKPVKWRKPEVPQILLSDLASPWSKPVSAYNKISASTGR